MQNNTRMERARNARSRRNKHAGRWVLPALLGLGLAGCTGSTGQPGGEAGYGAAPVVITPQRDWSDAIIYFVILDRFADGDSGNNANVQRTNPGGYHGGDLKGLTSQLDEIADLGATAIWITPVPLQVDFAPIVPGMPETNGQFFEHWGFHGYWAEDFTRMEPHFGTEADLAALVAAAHQRGIKVLLDVVYNHAGYGSQYETDPRFSGWIRKKPVDCAADPLTCQVGGLPDFDTGRDDVRKYLLDANIGLAERTGLDGFRLDTVKHVEHDFWQLHRDQTRTRVSEDFFLLGEVWGGDARVLDEWFENDEMDSGFDFSFSGSCQSWVKGRGRTIAYASYLSKRHRVRDGYHLAHYLSSHDETMALHLLENDIDRFRMCVALQMTTLGIPVIYYGEEVARGGGAWPTNRKDMPWGSRKIEPGAGVARDESLRGYYKNLIALRRSHPALSRGDYEALSTDGDLLVFRRTDPIGGGTVIVAVNRGSEAATATVDLPAGWQDEVVISEVNSSAQPATDANRMEISVPPVQVRIFVAAKR